MAIQFHCHSCGKQFHVNDSMAGTQARCQQCGTVVTVPASAAGLQPMQPNAGSGSWAAQQPAKDPQYPVQESSGIPPLVWYLIAGGAVFVLFAIGIAVIFNALSSSSSDPEAESVASTTSSDPDDTPSALPGQSNVNSYRPPRSGASSASANTAPSGSFAPNRQQPADSRSGAYTGGTSATSAEPAESTRPAAPTTTNSEPPVGPSWQSDTLRIPFERQDDIVFGPIGCPVLIAKRDVWHLDQKRIVGTLPDDADPYRHKSLSGNGQWFAASCQVGSNRAESIHVWNTVTGELALEIPGDPDNRPELVEFSRNQYLLVGGWSSNEIAVWDVAEGRELPSITVPSRRVESGTTTFSADGQYFTAVVNDRLAVIDTKTRKTAAVMESPRPYIDPGEDLNDIQIKIRTSGIMREMEFVRFSPDGQELAAMCDSDPPRLLCWNSRGRLVFDALVPRVEHVFFFDPAFDWLPDASGWIISGHVYDRQTRQIVFAIRMPFADEPMFFPLDRNRLVGAFPHDPEMVQVMEIPWDQIEASLKLLGDQAPAVLAPYEPVSVDIRLAGLRGSGGETASMLREALSNRLQNDGIQIADGRPTIFRLRFSEKAGDTLPIYERQSAFDFRGSNTGRTATEAAGVLVVELIADGRILWRDTIKAKSSRSFREGINDATIRKSMLQNVTREMNQLGIPYFIPKSPDHLALPIVFE